MPENKIKLTYIVDIDFGSYMYVHDTTESDLVRVAYEVFEDTDLRERLAEKYGYTEMIDITSTMPNCVYFDLNSVYGNLTCSISTTEKLELKTNQQ